RAGPARQGRWRGSPALRAHGRPDGGRRGRGPGAAGGRRRDPRRPVVAVGGRPVERRGGADDGGAPVDARPAPSPVYPTSRGRSPRLASGDRRGGWVAGDHT